MALFHATLLAFVLYGLEYSGVDASTSFIISCRVGIDATRVEMQTEQSAHIGDKTVSLANVQVECDEKPPDDELFMHMREGNPKIPLSNSSTTLGEIPKLNQYKSFKSTRDVELSEISQRKIMQDLQEVKVAKRNRLIEERFDDLTLFPGYIFKQQSDSQEITEPHALLQNMDEEELSAFRAHVIHKYGKDGRNRRNDFETIRERKMEAKKYQNLHSIIREKEKELLSIENKLYNQKVLRT